MTASRVAAPMSAPPLRLIIGLGGLYVGQSVIGGVIFTGLPAVMRQNGASLNDIALILLTVLPWSFKFLWAPALERFRSPHGARRRSRLTIGLVGPFAVGAVVACALIGPTALGPLTIAMMVASFSSATIDIACDGHAVESLAEQNRGWGNAAQVGGAYLGSAIGGGLFLGAGVAQLVHGQRLAAEFAQAPHAVGQVVHDAAGLHIAAERGIGNRPCFRDFAGDDLLGAVARVFDASLKEGLPDVGHIAELICCEVTGDIEADQCKGDDRDALGPARGIIRPPLRHLRTGHSRQR